MSLEPEIVEAIDLRYGKDADIAVADGRLRISTSDGSTATCVVRRSRAARVEMSLAQSGILRSLPAGTAAPEVIVIAFEDGGAVLVPQPEQTFAGEPMSRERAEQIARGLAAMHSTFFGFPARLTASLGLAALAAWLRGDGLVRPETGSWDTLSRARPDLAETLDRLRQRPAALVEALRAHPATIVQGNPTPDCMSLDGDAVVFLDWSQTLRAPGAVDLGVLLASGWSSLVAHPDAVIEAYRAERERLGRLPSGGAGWDRELALGILAGVLRCESSIGEDMDFWTTAIDGCLPLLRDEH